jgi:hypothetical protein
VPTTWIGLVAASVASLSTLVYVWYFSAALHRDTCDTSFQARTADHDFAFQVLVVASYRGLWLPGWPWPLVRGPSRTHRSSVGRRDARDSRPHPHVRVATRRQRTGVTRLDALAPG